MNWSIRHFASRVGDLPQSVGGSDSTIQTLLKLSLRCGPTIFCDAEKGAIAHPDTIAQYSLKKPRTGSGQFSGEFLLGLLEWASVLRT